MTGIHKDLRSHFHRFLGHICLLNVPRCCYLLRTMLDRLRSSRARVTTRPSCLTAVDAMNLAVLACIINQLLKMPRMT